jgi:mono/diheme cytochrome c family protein
MKKFILTLTGFTLIGLALAQTGNLKSSIDSGKKVYDMYCLSCHMEDGNGVPRMNPPLSKTKWVLGDKKKLIAVILNGMDEEIDINGQSYSNTMAPHDYLKDQEIADVLTYIRNSFGNKASAVTIADVKAARATQKK